ncbi:uncharacterized protein EKO05_0010196 [Ascochyta rabiei]|nr:uncharacterized protein EKO05_0010196 [Ascochyta rabiei]UPX19947.1 hypothetical protein EKO05_0010196 [Ascochyta rabiei]
MPSSFCVAQKMSWAARRTTTRKEDIAYCLLGIFGINMPLLYGEEEMAFIRLQEEIMKSTPDPSILAWKLSSAIQDVAIGSHNSIRFPNARSGKEIQGSALLGVMSYSPAEFADCRNYERTRYDGLAESTITNIGVRTRAPLYSMYGSEGIGSVSIYPLYCALNKKYLGLHLRHVGRRRYLRQNPCTLVEYTPNQFLHNPPAESFLLTKLPRGYRWSDFRLAPTNETMRDLRAHVLHFTLTEKMTLYDPWPTDLYDSEDQLFFFGHVPREDLALIGLNCRFTISSGGIPHTVEMRCIFVASGWSKPSATQSQFSLLDAETDGSKVDVLRDRLRLGQDTRPSWVVLREAGLPTTLTVRHCVPETEIVAVISCQLQRRVPDEKISNCAFYDVKFILSLYSADDCSIPAGA